MYQNKISGDCRHCRIIIVHFVIVDILVPVSKKKKNDYHGFTDLIMKLMPLKMIGYLCRAL